MIGRCLAELIAGHEARELDVLVVCNGCSDDTAQIARQFGSPVRVLETDVPSKTNALNLGDAAAQGFPRIYVDADVVIDLASIRALATVLLEDKMLACSPEPINVFDPKASWSVRAYYRFWMALPYVQDGMIAAGVYALSEAGRQRFQQFPDIIADDGFVRLHFGLDERKLVQGAQSEVRAPLSLRDLMKIKTRSRLGELQLWKLYPDLCSRDLKTKHYSNAMFEILRQPSLYFAVIPYLYVNLISRIRANLKFWSSERYVWERDISSRSAPRKD